MKLAQQKSSNVEQQKVETFDTLSEKQSNILKEILEAEEDLRSAQDNLSNSKSLNKQVSLSWTKFSKPKILGTCSQCYKKIGRKSRKSRLTLKLKQQE